ncbi:MAG: hypothetical protein HY519_01545 [Candidatus Aenigmarchaeota archaeon]|nr:hypothetical protein [Candidatus Aenigmarchaeota archaeon]
MAMLILQVLRQKNYLALAALASAFMLFIYPYSQTLGNNIDLWFEIIQPANLVLYLAFAGLFGPFFALQVYNLRQPKVCNVKGSASAGFASSVLGFFAIQCPGCISFASLFLPLSATTFLAANNVVITAASVLLLVLGMHLLGAFRDAQAVRTNKQ